MADRLKTAWLIGVSLLAGCPSSGDSVTVYTSQDLSLIHLSEPTRRYAIPYAGFRLQKKNMPTRLDGCH